MTARYQAIDAEKDTRDENGEKKYPVTKMCALLEVSPSGYYEWRDRPASATAERREYLGLLIRAVFDDSDQTYGHRRIHAVLARSGESCTPELARSIMRDLGLQACQPRPWRHHLTQADPAAGPIPDLVNRDFTAPAPGQKMVGDITYIPTWKGWLYLATVIDCHTKAVIGWAMDDNYKTPLIEQAIAMAARNYPNEEGAIFHSDPATTPLTNSGKPSNHTTSDAPSDAPESATTTACQNRSSPP